MMLRLIIGMFTHLSNLRRKERIIVCFDLSLFERSGWSEIGHAVKHFVNRINLSYHLLCTSC